MNGFWRDIVFEPTCAFWMVGSYALLFVCPYGLDKKSDWMINVVACQAPGACGELRLKLA